MRSSLDLKTLHRIQRQVQLVHVLLREVANSQLSAPIYLPLAALVLPHQEFEQGTLPTAVQTANLHGVTRAHTTG